MKHQKSQTQNIHLSIEPCGYLKHEETGCLPWNDLHSMTSDGTTDHDNCMKWCNNNSECGGFVVNSQNTCYFKSLECENDIITNTNVVLYLKKGT